MRLYCEVAIMFALPLCGFAQPILSLSAPTGEDEYCYRRAVVYLLSGKVIESVSLLGNEHDSKQIVVADFLGNQTRLKMSQIDRIDFKREIKQEPPYVQMAVAVITARASERYQIQVPIADLTLAEYSLRIGLQHAKLTALDGAKPRLLDSDLDKSKYISGKKATSETLVPELAEIRPGRSGKTWIIQVQNAYYTKVVPARRSDSTVSLKGIR